MSAPKPPTSESTAPSPMLICPTSHDDWDWQQTFEQYYSTAFTGCGVAGIFDSVTSIFAGTSTADQAFCFSHAEVAYLRQYLDDNPTKAAVFQGAGARFCALGGGITSPDNQVCHGEVFIRNYLVGHAYLKSVGLYDQTFFVAWIPDDFGHDPQLPVLLEAMGMKAAGLSRVPGSPQPALCPEKQLTAAEVQTKGLTFRWPGRDGSSVITHFMPSTYYGITNYGLSSATSSTSAFLGAHGANTWPGGLYFAVQGGDWQFPQNGATPCGTLSGAYEWQSIVGATVTGGSVTVSTSFGTFADYFTQLAATGASLARYPLFAENYYTGYFASRPQLKIDHYASAQSLLGAEVLGAILALHGGAAQATTPLGQEIDSAWQLLVPTSHHDFVTGTSPDTTYKGPTGSTTKGWDANGQLAMSKRARSLAEGALALGLSELAGAVQASPSQGETPVVVFNQLGLDLPATAIVEMADPSGGSIQYRVRVGSTYGPVQRSSAGTLLFQVPGLRSMAYTVVYLSAAPAPAKVSGIGPVTGDGHLDNGTVQLTLSAANGWAISALTAGGESYLQPGALANALQIWTDEGNIYQFGMEYIESSGCGTGKFEAEGSALETGAGAVVEAGPVRYRFSGSLTDSKSGIVYTTQYDLVAGEALVRITTTGAAPQRDGPIQGTSVLASFDMQTAQGEVGNVLEYGTSYSWENRSPARSWSGLTFRATHDFAELVAEDGPAVAAVYHDGIPAWTIDGSTLLGCLFRNTPGGNRAASGTDSDPHTQSYTLDVRPSRASTGGPLRTALYASTAVRAAVIGESTGTMPTSAQLASVAQSDAVLRVGKVSGSPPDLARLVLRVQKTGDGTEPLEIDVPSLARHPGAAVEILTALETRPDRAPPALHIRGTTIQFDADRAVWTLQIAM